MKQQSLTVCLALIEQDGKLLMAQRRPDVFLEPNKWGFPGGKIEFGEHPEEAMLREIKEELGVEGQVEKLRCVHSHIYTVGEVATHVVALVYDVKILSGTPEALDDQKLEWVAKDQVTTYDLVEGNKAIIDTCLGIAPRYSETRSD